MHHVRCKNNDQSRERFSFVALLTRLVVVNYAVEATLMKVLIKADWSDNNSTLTWKTPNDIRTFHLQVRWDFSTFHPGFFFLDF